MILYTKKKVSPRGKINKEDLKSLGRAVLKYTSPLLITFLLALQRGVPVQDALWLVYGAALQLLINLLSKFNAGPDA